MPGDLRKIRVRPSAAMSKLGVLTGLGMMAFGVLFIVPMLDGFGPGLPFLALWLAVTGGLTYYHYRNAFGPDPKGVAYAEIDIEGGEDFDAKLRKLDALKRDGLVSAAEYERKRSELLAEKW